MMNPTTRFSDRVSNYVRHRPAYPDGVISILREELGLNPDSDVADLGSGTGVLTRQLLPEVRTVYAIEPNAKMREAAEEALAGTPGFRSIDGTAEATTLPDACVDLATAAQAFHWFRHDAVRRELSRILRPGGGVAILWNVRRTEPGTFGAAYEEFLNRFGTDYQQVRVGHPDRATLDAFFGPEGCRLRKLPNAQTFDFDGLHGRVLSSSYMPREGGPGYEPMLRELRTLFDRFATDGRLELTYDTEIYFGRLSGVA